MAENYRQRLSNHLEMCRMAHSDLKREVREYPHTSEDLQLLEEHMEMVQQRLKPYLVSKYQKEVQRLLKKGHALLEQELENTLNNMRVYALEQETEHGAV